MERGNGETSYTGCGILGLRYVKYVTERTDPLTDWLFSGVDDKGARTKQRKTGSYSVDDHCFQIGKKKVIDHLCTQVTDSSSR